MNTVGHLITDCNIGGQLINQHRFTVVRGCKYRALLGMDLFPALNVKIHVGNTVCCDNAGTTSSEASYSGSYSDDPRTIYVCL